MIFDLWSQPRCERDARTQGTFTTACSTCSRERRPRTRGPAPDARPRVFFTYPLRAEEPVEQLLATLRTTEDPNLAGKYGLDPPVD